MRQIGRSLTMWTTVMFMIVLQMDTAKASGLSETLGRFPPEFFQHVAKGQFYRLINELINVLGQVIEGPYNKTPPAFSTCSGECSKNTLDIDFKVAEKIRLQNVSPILDKAADNFYESKTWGQFLNKTQGLLNSLESVSQWDLSKHFAPMLAELSAQTKWLTVPTESGDNLYERREMWWSPIQTIHQKAEQRITKLRENLQKMLKASTDYPLQDRMTPVKAWVFPEKDFGSPARKISFDSQACGGCRDLPRDFAKSINTQGTCIRLYKEWECNGSYELVDSWSGAHTDIPGRYGFVPKSIGPCWLGE